MTYFLNWLEENQYTLMLFLSGVCAALSLFAIFFRAVSIGRKKTLIALSLTSIWLLLSTCNCHVFEGHTSAYYVMGMRISMFSVFFSTVLLIHVFNAYLKILFKYNQEIKCVPIFLKVSNILAYIGEALVVLNQFTGIYYSFDENNMYQRSAAYSLAYLFPVLIAVLQLFTIIIYYKKFCRIIRLPLVLFTLAPVFGAVFRYYYGGISFTGIAMVAFVIILHMFVIVDVNGEMAAMHDRELAMLYEEQRRDYLLIYQTASSLSGAIDAKDHYTHGHSSRVAKYAKAIARASGEPEDICDQVFLAGLLHDVGKIGIPDSIINKPGKLTVDEFAVIKTHPVLGKEILEKISALPSLSIGAHYHHERWDGKGYPDGLYGSDIPKVARIIAVADAYDAMTSKRSYRETLTQAEVRRRIAEGVGTQFDPKYANIMLGFIDDDVDYLLREGLITEDV